MHGSMRHDFIRFLKTMEQRIGVHVWFKEGSTPMLSRGVARNFSGGKCKAQAINGYHGFCRRPKGEAPGCNEVSNFIRNHSMRKQIPYLKIQQFSLQKSFFQEKFKN